MLTRFPALLLLAAMAQQADAPVDVGLEEEVAVQLVLIEAVVTDREGNTVPGLTREDFDVIAAGKPVEIATLDVDCPLGRAADPRPGAYRKRHRRWMPRPDAPLSQPRRLVLVFDHANLRSVHETYTMALEALEDHLVGGEQHMVVALGSTLRVEQAFTTDIDAVRKKLLRMRDDPALYFGNHRSATLFPYFSKMQALMTLLEQVDGRKTIVLYSGAFGSDGFLHDRAFEEIAAAAARAQTTIYAVDTAGLTFGGGLLGPPLLRRLAIETGGRMTASTNDLTLGYARAQRDAGCRYTLGFYAKDDEPERARKLAIHVRGSGYRVHHSAHYRVRSERDKRLAQREAAYLSKYEDLR